MLDTCYEHNHCIVVFDVHECPVCQDIEQFEGDILNLEDKVDGLENE